MKTVVPIANALVQVVILSNGWGAGGYTDAQGNFAGKMPKDEEMSITISQSGNCFSSSTTNIGPFSADTNIGDIVVTSADLIEVAGTIVDCLGSPITSGWITYSLGNQSGYYYLENTNIVNLALFNCNNATEFTFAAVNLDDLEMSDEVTVPVAPMIDLGQIDACGNTLDEFITITVNGESRTLIFPEGGYIQTFTYLNVFDSLSTESFSMNFSENAVGTYTGSSIGSIHFNLEFPTPGLITMECGGMNCGLDELVITEYGAAGSGQIIGTFSGTTNFYDNMGNTLPDLPYSGSFKVDRDQ